MKKRKPLRSIFLLAAQKQFTAKESVNYPVVYGQSDYQSVYACDNIGYAGKEIINNNYSFCCTTEHEFFEKYFKPVKNDPPGGLISNIVEGGWWWKKDQEARILALLLCAEMLRR